MLALEPQTCPRLATQAATGGDLSVTAYAGGQHQAGGSTRRACEVMNKSIKCVLCPPV